MTDDELAKLLEEHNAKASPAPTAPPRSLLDKITSFVTGAGRYDPNIPELSNPHVLPEETPLSARAAPLMTSDPQFLTNIYSKVPGVTSGADQYGNPTVTMPGGQTYYPNRPGISAVDVVNAAPMVGLSALGAPAVAALPTAAARVGGAVLGEGLLAGGMDVATNAAGGEVGPGRLAMDTLFGGAGALLAPGIAAIGRQMLRPFQSVLSKSEIGPLMEKAGVQWNILPTESKDAITTSLSKMSSADARSLLKDPEKARTLYNQQLSKEFDLDYSRGQVTGNIGQLRREGDLTASDPEGPLGQLAKRQKESLDKILDQWYQDQSVAKAGLDVKTAVNDAYGLAKDAETKAWDGFLTKNGKTLINGSLDQSVTRVLGDDVPTALKAPIAYDARNYIANLSKQTKGGVTVRNLVDTRDALNNKIASLGNSPTADVETPYLRRMVDGIDQFLRDRNVGVYKEMQEPMRLSGQITERFNPSNQAGKFMQSIIRDSGGAMSPEEVFRRFQGSGADRPVILQGLKNAQLGPATEPMINSLKQGYLRTSIYGGGGKIVSDLSPAQVVKSLDKILDDPLAIDLFSQVERDQFMRARGAINNLAQSASGGRDKTLAWLTKYIPALSSSGNVTRSIVRAAGRLPALKSVAEANNVFQQNMAVYPPRIGAPPVAPGIRGAVAGATQPVEEGLLYTD